MTDKSHLVKLVWSKKDFKRSANSEFAERVASDSSLKNRWLLEIKYLPSGHLTTGCLNIFLQSLGAKEYPLSTNYDLRVETSGQFLYHSQGSHEFAEFGEYLEDSISELEFQSSLVNDILMVTINLQVSKSKTTVTATVKPEIKLLNAEGNNPVLTNTWRNNIYNMFLSKSLIDVIVVSENVYIGAHRVVLASSSSVLQRLLEAGTSKNTIQILELHHYNYETIHEIIKFLYTRKAPPFTHFDHCLVLNILEASYTFDIAALKHLSGRYILSNLNDKNVVDAAILAHKNGMTELQKETSEYISSKKNDLELPEMFEDFMKLPKLMKEVLGDVAEHF